jgi:hypothetical protein
MAFFVREKRFGTKLEKDPPEREAAIAQQITWLKIDLYNNHNNYGKEIFNITRKRAQATTALPNL